MEDTLHYTFSTIPQVLAAIIALLGVFWVFKITHLNNQLKTHAEILSRDVDFNNPTNRKYLNELKKNLIEKFNYSGTQVISLKSWFDSAIIQENFEWIYKTIYQISEAVPNKIAAGVKMKYEDIGKEKIELTFNTKLVLILSGIQIVLSVSLLILVPIIYSICYLPYFVMIPNLIFFLLIIFLTIRTILRALQIKKHVT